MLPTLSLSSRFLLGIMPHACGCRSILYLPTLSVCWLCLLFRWTMGLKVWELPWQPTVLISGRSYYTVSTAHDAACAATAASAAAAGCAAPASRAPTAC